MIDQAPVHYDFFLVGAAEGDGFAAGAEGIAAGRITGAPAAGGRVTGALVGGRITGALAAGGRITGAVGIAVGRETAPPVVRMFGADAGAFSAELIGPGPGRDEVTMPDGGLTEFGGKAPPPTPEARPAVCPFTVMFLFTTLVLELLILLTVLLTYDLLIFVWFT